MPGRGVLSRNTRHKAEFPDSPALLHDVVISEEVGCAKPGAGIFDAAFARMGNPRKEEVLILGDSLTSDIRGGSDYGIATCWFNPDGEVRDADVESRYEIRSLHDVPGIVGVA